jgi:hypothetical protein
MSGPQSALQSPVLSARCFSPTNSWATRANHTFKTPPSSHALSYLTAPAFVPGAQCCGGAFACFPISTRAVLARSVGPGQCWPTGEQALTARWRSDITSVCIKFAYINRAC